MVVLYFEAPILGARDVERTPIPALEPQSDERSAAPDDRAAQEVLKEAQRLLMQVLSILNDPICAKRSTAAGAFRLARGHALTLLDHLTSMADSSSVSVARAGKSGAGTSK
jgi:hypothetical protein